MDASTMDLMKFDDTFLGILQHLGKIEPFLDAIFFFLARRTDFFKLMHNRDDKMGFPPGVAEQVVMKIFKKYQALVLKNDSRQAKERPHHAKISSPEKVETNKSEVVVPEAIETVEIETEKPQNSLNQNVESKQNQDVKSDKPAASNVREPAISEPSPSLAEGKDASNAEKPPGVADPDSYNGAVTDRYSWSQTATDVDVKIFLPSFVKKSKDLDVVITYDHIKVLLKRDPPPDSGLENRIILDGMLTNRVRCEESLWSLVDGKSIQISLEKAKDIYWTALLKGEPEIDKTKLDTTRNIAEFDEQTQADFQKVMFDHHQKLQGKPTSEEQKTQDLLKQAWDAEGSPFKGTPFDPSRVNISSGNG